MDIALAVTAFATLFVIIDPIGLAPMFLALTQGMGKARRRALAIRACAVAAAVLTIFGLFGSALLDGLGVSLDAFRISGGLLLFLIAIEMLFEKRTQRREQTHGDEDHDPSVFPLGTPLIAGPGAMAAMILLSTNNSAGWIGVLEVHLVMLSVISIVLVLFLMADAIEKALGRTGILVVTRLMGMLLAALAVQFVLDGLRSAGVIPV
ncbi:MAG: MarC family protein [Mangrovicoccus sp.]|nr:MarC family protein [Mangrovicoccus sp.]